MRFSRSLKKGFKKAQPLPMARMMANIPIPLKLQTSKEKSTKNRCLLAQEKLGSNAQGEDVINHVPTSGLTRDLQEMVLDGLAHRATGLDKQKNTHHPVNFVYASAKERFNRMKCESVCSYLC
jgi:hypothetical protein